MNVPPRRVLAAVDFSEPSRTALTFAARLARHCNAELHVLHAEDPLLCAAARTGGVDLRQQTRDELATFLAASALPAGLAIHTHVIGGVATSVICDIAMREEADVIVLAARGISGGERFLFGSTAEGVLRHAHTPVLIVPPDWSAPAAETYDLSGLGPVIAAVDFTSPSVDAAAAACRLAQTLHTSLELLHVVPDLPVLERWKAQAADAITRRVAEAEHELSTVTCSLDARVGVERRIESGRVAERIAEAAHIGGGRQPLLVLGRRRPGERGGAPGATAYRVLTLAHVPVLMYLPSQE